MVRKPVDTGFSSYRHAIHTRPLLIFYRILGRLDSDRSDNAEIITD